MLTGEHLKLVNGWSNSYWGWGGEDDDMRRRILNHGLVIWSYPKELATYKMLHHKESPKNPIRYKILEKSEQNMAKDGLNSLTYQLQSKISFPLYTSINVDIG
ncbi:UNVERIFIED_CONTAM: hypothetical protein GTU68_043386 [Idotea baltica]|nr:hypothetical protein [Idotea baltica]